MRRKSVAAEMRISIVCLPKEEEEEEIAVMISCREGIRFLLLAVGSEYFLFLSFFLMIHDMIKCIVFHLL